MSDASKSDGAVRIGAFTFDLPSRELRQGKTKMRLPEQPFEILRLLVEQPGRVVTRDELRQRLWPDGTFVDFEHSLNTAIKRLRVALGDEAECPSFIETIPRRGYRLIAPVGTTDPATIAASATARPGSRVSRLAVLPFANLSGDPAQQYFSDGLTEEMIAQLGRLCGDRIGVLARWSSMAAPEGRRGAREIGEALKADYLLEGSVRREGGRVRITARLVAAREETHLWAESYERNLVDCLSVQADVAARIAQSLATELLEDGDGAPERMTKDAEAYHAFLKGRFHWNKPGDDGLAEALTYFEDALRRDPGFAAAHASRARALIAQAEYYAGVPRDLLLAARLSAEQALTLDPTHWRAHVARGDLCRLLDWDWSAAEAAYLEACSLNPSSESAHRSYGIELAVLGRHVEARRMCERAVELDPLCMVVGVTAAWVQYLGGDYAGAIERCRHYIEMDADYGFSAARRTIAAAYLQIGRPQDAIAELEQGLDAGRTEPVLLAWLAHARAVTGDVSGAQALLATLHDGAGRSARPYHLALALVGVGEIDRAFEALEQARADRDPVLAYVAVEPRFAPLRSDVRYASLLESLNLLEKGNRV